MDCGGNPEIDEGSGEPACREVLGVQHGEEIDWGHVQELNRSGDEDPDPEMFGGRHFRGWERR